MREIKFRAWDGERMIADWAKVTPYAAQVVGDVNLPAYFSPSFTMGTAQAVMQYTGLKDSQGVEIYEGDIVQAIEFADRGDGYWDDTLLIVTWSHELAGFCFSDPQAVGDIGMADVEIGERAGNIHENPELLVQLGNIVAIKNDQPE